MLTVEWFLPSQEPVKEEMTLEAFQVKARDLACKMVGKVWSRVVTFPDGRIHSATIGEGYWA